MEIKDRPTTLFTTPSGVVIKLRTYITGREFNEMQAIYTENTKVTMVGGNPQIDGFDVKSEERVVKKLIEVAIVAVNDSTENVVEAVMELPLEDYQSVMAELDILSGKGKKKAVDTQTA